jgi:hypothetical protein
MNYIPRPQENSDAGWWSSMDGTLIAIRKVAPPDLQRATSLFGLGLRVAWARLERRTNREEDNSRAVLVVPGARHPVARSPRRHPFPIRTRRRRSPPSRAASASTP